MTPSARILDARTSDISADRRRTRRTVVAVTGTRADFGLLRPVLEAITDRAGLELRLVAAGAHLLPPDETIGEVEAAFPVAARVPMQRPGTVGRLADAVALAQGIEGVAHRLADLIEDPENAFVLVLGDRIEAFAAASAAAIAGIRVAHVHGGDRAEGVADESMRHAISKLAHVHLAATEASAERLIRMGERPETVHVVGSPAIDGLHAIPPLDDAAWDELGRPSIVLLMHPIGRSDERELADAEHVLAALRRVARARLGTASSRADGDGPDDESNDEPTMNVLALHPNHDPGRAGIVEAIEAAARDAWGEGPGEGPGDRPGAGPTIRVRSHLPRSTFVGLLRRTAVLVGNSSAGLIEAPALGVPVVDLGPRQGGRERPRCVIHVLDPAVEGGVEHAVERALERGQPGRPGRLGRFDPGPPEHPYGDGRAGHHVAELLAAPDLGRYPIRKRNAY